MPARRARRFSLYRTEVERRSERTRTAEDREKTGVFLGTTCTNPATGGEIPVFVADYVILGYGTGAVMSVPGSDQRDWDFAVAYGLPIVRTVQPPPEFSGEAYTGEGPAINSGFLDGLGIDAAKAAIAAWLEEHGHGEATTTYRLRDWLFSRQRYWGEPFPILFDEEGLPVAVPDELLPVLLPDLDDWSPRALAEDSEPEPPLGRIDTWATVELDLGNGPKRYRRELNTMPQWAGSCWYYLRYLDPTNTGVICDPIVERYWMGPTEASPTGGVDLYVGGVEHAVLHLLYSRFWHKVLHDLGHVTAIEPFHRLFNQGYIQAFAYRDARGFYVEASEVSERAGEYFHDGRPVTREYGKMGKSLRNSVTPDEMYASYGADTLRLYEMFTGPLDQSRPWNTRDVVGVFRLLQRIWRLAVDEESGDLRVSAAELDEETLRVLHRTIAAVREAFEALRPNVAIARITELVNHLTAASGAGGAPRAAVGPLALLLAPLAPHMAEELWSRLGEVGGITRAPFPEADEAYLREETISIGVSVNGRPRATVQIAIDADDAAHESPRVPTHASPPISRMRSCCELSSCGVDWSISCLVDPVPTRMGGSKRLEASGARIPYKCGVDLG